MGNPDLGRAVPFSSSFTRSTSLQGLGLTGAIVRLVCENCGVKSNQIGAIDLGRDSSFFEVSKEAATAIRQGMQNLKLDGREVSIRSPSGGERKPTNQPHRKKNQG